MIFKRKLDPEGSNTYLSTVNNLFSLVNELRDLLTNMSYDLNEMKHRINRPPRMNDQAYNMLSKNNIKTFKSRILERAMYYLSVVDYMKTTEILEQLEREGFVINSKNPVNYISTILSGSLLFDYCEGAWRLASELANKQ